MPQMFGDVYLAVTVERLYIFPCLSSFFQQLKILLIIVNNCVITRGLQSLDLCLKLLQTKFEDFMHELDTSEHRVTRVFAMADSMLSNGHFEADNIRQRRVDIQQLWAELIEVAKARQEVCVYLICEFVHRVMKYNFHL